MLQLTIDAEKIVYLIYNCFTVHDLKDTQLPDSCSFILLHIIYMMSIKISIIICRLNES